MALKIKLFVKRVCGSRLKFVVVSLIFYADFVFDFFIYGVYEILP